jgi:hypothetical protein
VQFELRDVRGKERFETLPSSALATKTGQQSSGRQITGLSGIRIEQFAVIAGRLPIPFRRYDREPCRFRWRSVNSQTSEGLLD